MAVEYKQQIFPEVYVTHFLLGMVSEMLPKQCRDAELFWWKWNPVNADGWAGLCTAGIAVIHKALLAQVHTASFSLRRIIPCGALHTSAGESGMDFGELTNSIAGDQMTLQFRKVSPVLALSPEQSSEFPNSWTLHISMFGAPRTAMSVTQKEDKHISAQTQSVTELEHTLSSHNQIP